VCALCVCVRHICSDNRGLEAERESLLPQKQTRTTLQRHQNGTHKQQMSDAEYFGGGKSVSPSNGTSIQGRSDTSKGAADSRPLPPRLNTSAAAPTNGNVTPEKPAKHSQSAPHLPTLNGKDTRPPPPLSQVSLNMLGPAHVKGTPPPPTATSGTAAIPRSLSSSHLNAIREGEFVVCVKKTLCDLCLLLFCHRVRCGVYNPPLNRHAR
jgi:hypothetical protein